MGDGMSDKGLTQTPIMDKIDISYTIHGKQGNHKIVNGVDVAGVTAGVTVKFRANEFPEVTVDLSPVEITFNGEGQVYFDGKKFPQEMGRKLYEALKAKYERPNDKRKIRRCV